MKIDDVNQWDISLFRATIFNWPLIGQQIPLVVTIHVGFVTICAAPAHIARPPLFSTLKADTSPLNDAHIAL